jgi:DNA-binding response OmpR family regulator
VIAIVERDRDQLSVLEVALSGEGFRVLPFDDGGAALSHFERGGEPPSLLLLDAGLRGVSASALRAWMALDPRFAAVPVVAMSTVPRTAPEFTTLDGLAGVLVKPIPLTELIAVVRSFAPHGVRSGP